MTPRSALCLVGFVMLAASSELRAAAPPVPSSAAAQRAVLDRYRVTCHNQRAKTAGLTLDTLNLTTVGEHAEVWEKVVRKLRGGLMPPAGRPRPDAVSYNALASWLEAELDRAAAARPNPGRTEPVHRLNRAEYRSAIRDLLSLDIDVSDLLPADDGGYGFDNIAGVLKLDESRMERYLSAASRISRVALGSVGPGPVVTEFAVPEELRQYDQIEGLPFGTRGGALVRHYFPNDAEYLIKVDLFCKQSTDCDPAAGFADPHQLEVAVDGDRVGLFTVEPRPRRAKKIDGVDEAFRVRVPVKAGPRRVGVAFLKVSSAHEVESPRQRFLKPLYIGPNGTEPDNQTIYQPHVGTVTITGPFDAAGPGDTPSRRRIMACTPASSADELRCAKTILSTLARRAHRRPVADEDMRTLLAFYDQGHAQGGFEAGIELALRRLLVSPEFLFRIERDPAGTTAGAMYRVSDLELASRLSFFLWSSIPDDELLNVAIKGQLADPAVLERQVRRMLADDRSGAIIDNFVGQWLQLRNVQAARPSTWLYPDFDEDLRLGFRRETELFADSILRGDRNVLELLTADYTFVNERLARHYGIPHVRGAHFRRVTFGDDHRRGLLGHGSILTVSSRPNRTSPVLRGKWILENLLGTPPPPPPPNVPPFQEKKDGSSTGALSVRERMAAHRANPACASCHSMIDPPGFALENFDAIGRWRDVDEDFNPIDASGALPDGTAFSDLAKFRAALLDHPDRFVTTLTERLLTYALGRGVEYYDQPAIRRTVHTAARSGYRFSSIVLGIVKSAPFQMRRALAPAMTVSAAW